MFYNITKVFLNIYPVPKLFNFFYNQIKEKSYNHKWFSEKYKQNYEWFIEKIDIFGFQFTP